MAYAVGFVLSIAVALFLGAVRFDRDRAVYPTILIVIASYYVLFAVMGGSNRALVIESAVMVGFALVAVLGFARNLWWVAAATAGHGVFDIFHGGLIANPGVPAWWPAWCMSYDVGFGACLAVLLLRRRIRATAAGSERELNA